MRLCNYKLDIATRITGESAVMGLKRCCARLEQFFDIKELLTDDAACPTR